MNMFRIVSEADAKLMPYPFVFVCDDGTARELHAKEREYLETPFDPCDGGRPYIKGTYEQKNGWGKIHGFCKRDALPCNLHVSESPAEDPTHIITKDDIVQLHRQLGFDVEEKSDGTVVVARRMRKRWWHFWR